MKSFVSLVISAAPMFVSAGELNGYAPVAATSRRQLMTCDQTYGAASVQCGDASAGMCYKPSQGEVIMPDPNFTSAKP